QLASVRGPDVGPVNQLILSREANEFCRGQAVNALGLLAAPQELPHQEVSDYFGWMAREGLEREASFVWDELACTCVDIEALSVFPELRRAYEANIIFRDVIGSEELDEAEAGPRGSRLAKFRDEHPPIIDVV